MTNLADTRRQYDYSSLTRKQLDADPFKQMQLWLQQAKEAELKDATSMTLATNDSTGDNSNMPDARIVLLKQLDKKGLCWYTNYASHKGQQLANNPQACLLFYWRDFDRQVKIQGQVEKLGAAEADAYFHSRPLASQLSAAASAQSQPIASRDALEDKLQQLQNHAANSDASTITRPESWGGYRLVPQTFEFWQGRENRLHDRFTYTLDNRDNGDNAKQWTITRLQP